MSLNGMLRFLLTGVKKAISEIIKMIISKGVILILNQAYEGLNSDDSFQVVGQYLLHVSDDAHGWR